MNPYGYGFIVVHLIGLLGSWFDDCLHYLMSNMFGAWKEFKRVCSS